MMYYCKDCGVVVNTDSRPGACPVCKRSRSNDGFESAVFKRLELDT